jgi:hypothetical protein
MGPKDVRGYRGMLPGCVHSREATCGERQESPEKAAQTLVLQAS